MNANPLAASLSRTVREILSLIDLELEDDPLAGIEVLLEKCNKLARAVMNKSIIQVEKKVEVLDKVDPKLLCFGLPRQFRVIQLHYPHGDRSVEIRIDDEFHPELPHVDGRPYLRREMAKCLKFWAVALKHLDNNVRGGPSGIIAAKVPKKNLGVKEMKLRKAIDFIRVSLRPPKNAAVAKHINVKVNTFNEVDPKRWTKIGLVFAMGMNVLPWGSPAGEPQKTA